MNITRVRGLASLAKVLVCGIVLVVSSLNYAMAQGWASSFEQARDIARKQGRPIFVDFTTSWCGVCKIMDRTVMADPAIIGRLDNFVKVKVDGDARPDLCSAYGVAAYPTFVHLDPQGRVIAKREGQMRTQEMASALDSTWQTVAASMMAIQANRKDETKVARATPATTSKDSNLIVATNDNRLVPSAATESNQHPASSAQERLARSAAAPQREIASATAENPNMGSVYAMGAGPETGHRSRFGGGASAAQSEGGLRQLAESTAKPGNIEEGDDSEQNAKPESNRKLETPASESSKDSEKSVTKTPEMAISSAKTLTEPAQADASKAEVSKVIAMAAPTKSTYAPAAIPAKSAQPVNASSGSAIVQSRLSMVSEDELPKPMLQRSTSVPTQAMNPGASVSVVPESAYSLAALKQSKADVEAIKPPTKIVSIAPDKPIVKSAIAEVPKATAAEEPAKSKTTEAEAKKSNPEETNKADKATKADVKSDSDQKISDKASVSDINRWFKDADGKLIDGHKNEARAMYSKVVENDPKNVSGKSDMAYIKMVSLIVDRDSDLQRKEAYKKIREFEARYPDSDHKDYYTLIRAILAVDLDEITEAHRLLATFANRFPDSKYAKLAHDNWKALPSLKKDTTSASKKSSGESSKKSSSSSSSKKSSSKS